MAETTKITIQLFDKGPLGGWRGAVVFPDGTRRFAKCWDGQANFETKNAARKAAISLARQALKARGEA